jgi:hypothetical protein
MLKDAALNALDAGIAGVREGRERLSIVQHANY